MSIYYWFDFANLVKHKNLAAQQFYFFTVSKVFIFNFGKIIVKKPHRKSFDHAGFLALLGRCFNFGATIRVVFILGR